MRPQHQILAGLFRALHAASMTLFPVPFRVRHESAMRATFDDALTDATDRRGMRGLVATAFAEITDTVQQGLRARGPAGGSGPPHGSSASNRHGGALDALGNDIRYAVRSLRRRHALSAVLALALGIGATGAVFSVADAIMLRSLPYPDADRIVRIGSQRPGSDRISSLSPPLFRALDDIEGIERSAASSSRYMTLTGSGQPERLRSAWVSHAFFDVLGGRAEHGRLFVGSDDAGDAMPVAVLGHDLWTGRFGADTDLIGEAVVLDGTVYEVIGVLGPGFVAPEGNYVSNATDIWLPLGQLDLMGEPGLSFLDAIAVADEGVSFATLATEVDAVGRALGEQLQISSRAYETMRTAPLRGETIGAFGDTLLPLVGAVGLLLLIACANVANIMLTRTRERTREISLRRALGAGAGRITRLLLLESTLLAGIGGALGVGIAFASVGALRAFRPAAIPRLAEVAVDVRALAFVAGVSALTGIVIGLIPAARAGRASPGAALGAARSSTHAGGRLRASSALVSAQIAIALVLTISAALLVHSFVRLAGVDIGFETDNQLRMQVSLGDVLDGSDEMQAQRRLFFGQLRERVDALPGVDGAWLTTGAPFSTGGWYSVISVVGRDEGEPGGPGVAETAHRHQVSAGRLRGMGLDVLAGREITAADRDGSEPVVVVNRNLAERYWPDGDAVGSHVTIGGDGTFTERTVVGIVSNARYGELEDADELHIYLPFEQFPAFTMDLVARHRGDAAPVAEAMRTAVWDLRADLAINDLRPMDELVYEELVEPGFYTWLLSSFAVIAALLAAVGVYGSMASATAARTREIGVRLAIGARPSDTVWMVLRSALMTSAIGLGIGLAAAWATTRYLSSFLFEVQPTDALAYGGASLLFALTAALAAWLPARRAARVDPVKSLRAE